MKSHSNNFLLERGKNLVPHIYREEFEKYLSEVSPEFPNVPRDAFEEWIYPFWNEHISLLYGGLDFKKLNFSLDTWPMSKFHLVKCYKKFDRHTSIQEEGTIEHLYQCYAYHKEAVSYWKDLGTWFKPPWVLDSNSFPSEMLHRDIEKPLMLIEGHTRLGGLRLHDKNGLASQTHKIWVISNKSKSK
jgi:hypothetical protein